MGTGEKKTKKKKKKVKFLHIMQMCKLFLAKTGLTEGATGHVCSDE